MGEAERDRDKVEIGMEAGGGRGGVLTKQFICFAVFMK